MKTLKTMIRFTLDGKKEKKLKTNLVNLIFSLLLIDKTFTGKPAFNFGCCQDVRSDLAIPY